MHDEYRVRVEVPAAEVRALLGALHGLELDAERRAALGRVAVTHDAGEVFLYADSGDVCAAARSAVEQALSEHELHGSASSWRWHPEEERWEEASAPLPSTEPEHAAEHAQRQAGETAESMAAGYPEWEVRITLPSHADARAFAERLQSEGIPVLQRWRHLLVGANDEDDAHALAERLRSEAPTGSELSVEGNGLPIWQMLHPFALFGGIAN